MIQSLATLFNVVLILLGFGLVIVVHELGHFIAARWAGIRVHAFAVGFGPAIFSFRKGLGFRKGSSEEAYFKHQEVERTGINRVDAPAMSATEYRLNWVPLGGYVKMLGQEDLNAEATSNAADSFQSVAVWKRMIVISAGVVMNVILAAVLFVVVFMSGMRVVSPGVGYVAPASAAEAAGFRAGDVVLSINGKRVDNFADISIASAMAKRDQELVFTVARAGVDEPITLKATPRRDEVSGLLQLGLGPAEGTRVVGGEGDRSDADAVRRQLLQAGLSSVEPGSTLVAVNDEVIHAPKLAPGVAMLTPLLDAMERSEGKPVRARFAAPTGAETTVTLQPRVALQRAQGEIDSTASASFSHLLGMVPVTRVQTTTAKGDAAGLVPGDLIMRAGGVDWPSAPDAVAQIRQRAGKTIPLVVLRPVAGDADAAAEGVVVVVGRQWRIVELDAPVAPNGQIGFGFEEATDLPLMTRAPRLARDPETKAIPAELSIDRLFPRVMPGMVIESVDGTRVENFAQARDAIVRATRGLVDEAGEGSDAGASREVTIELGLIDAATLQRLGSETRTIEVFAGDAKAIAALGWTPGPVSLGFAYSSLVMQAENPVSALAMGVRETGRRVTQSYITLKRLFEGTVQVRHLKGPVGITHIGSQMAAAGPIYLLFFLALISANLAVINFLPMPIVDGGMFLLLCYEAIRGKPAPIGFQNALNMIGLILIGCIFLTVTFYDIRGLFGL